MGAATAIKKAIRIEPEVGIVLGTGLGGFVESINTFSELPYAKIPHFPAPAVEGHRGALVCGELGGKKVACLQGRAHYYEGYSFEEIGLPIRVLGALGIRTIIISNAAGGLNPKFKIGDLMVITDHLNFMGANPLRGPNDPSLGPRFPSMIDCYDPSLVALAVQSAQQHNIGLRTGVYAALSGPSLETRAEYRFLAKIGADAVGMSTVPEVIIARHLGLRVLGFSVITNLGLTDTKEFEPVQNVLAVTKTAEPKLSLLVGTVLARLSN